MKCPSCITTNLVKTQRESFDIDYCPSCNGIWLERGELNKIVSKLSHADTSLPEEKNGPAKTTPVNKENHHSPILDSIENSRELYQLRKNEGKHHWIHRLFS